MRNYWIIFIIVNLLNSKNCYSIIPQTLNACLKRECDKFKNDSNRYNKKFEIKITIADHSSMLKNVRCKAKHLEKFLGTEVNIYKI